MKAISVKLTSVCVSLIVLSLVLTSVSVAKGKIDEKTLVALWLFDEGSGKTLKDQTKNGHDGKISGAKWTKAGKFGQALEFNGKDGQVEIDPHDDLNPTEQITVMAWVAATTKGTYNAVWSYEKGWGKFLAVSSKGKLAIAWGDIKTQ